MANETLKIYIMIIGIAIFTYIPRSFPLLYLSNKELPTWLKEWMKFIPAGIFAALIFPDIFTNGASLDISFSNIKLISSIAVLIVALKKKSLGLSIAVGVAVISLLEFVL